ncbi:MAG: hypothetical protein HZA63_12670 [Rhodocyclales bacterium]|nr:hypothetical protein [Rhodocyclales bacterium]
MAKWPKLDRRKFLLLVSGLGVALGAGGVATGVLVFSGGNPLLPGFRLDPDALLHVAEKYFASHPTEKSAEFLERELLAAVAPSGAGASLVDALAAAVRRDFDTRNTVVLDGWILSRTEVRVWVLQALK